MILSRVRALISFFLFAALSVAALADPPTRVARLAHVNGNVSFSPGGERDWGSAEVNRPLVIGDRLWVDRGSRAELQMGTVAVRAAGATNITLLNLDDRTTQIQLLQGTLHVSVRRLDRGQVVEINTPNLAFSIRRPGSYRIEVDPRNDWTEVAVMRGLARVFGDRRAFVVNERQGFVFYGAGLDDFEAVALRRPDEFDRWAMARERRWESSPSRRYVSPEMIGFADLDRAGAWKTVAQLGPVWIPRSVAADWAPYRDGHWSWIEPWGWTWIDEEPWAFATSHYGRWTRVDNRWAWVPGPANVRPVYAPALVAFVGNGSPGAPTSTVAWFPLGPRDVYRPSYTTSREYFYNLNASNARVDRQQLTAVYDNRSVNVTYVNRQVPGAIIAVPAAAFSQSQPVARITIRITDQGFNRAPVLEAPRVVPQQASVMRPAAARAVRPPETAPVRPVVAQVAPPPPPPPFAARQGALAANPGKPLDPAAVAAIKPAAPASAPVVKVVPETEAVSVPKAPAGASSAAAERRARRQRGGEAPAAAAPAAPASAAPAAPAPAAPAAPAAAAPAPTAPASADARPGARGRQRAEEAREAKEERERGRRPGAAQQPASAAAAPAPARPAPAAAPAPAPAPAPAAAPAPSAAGAAPPAAEAAPPAASRPGRPERRSDRARRAASAASAPADAGSAPQRR